MTNRPRVVFEGARHADRATISVERMTVQRAQPVDVI